MKLAWEHQDYEQNNSFYLSSIIIKAGYAALEVRTKSRQKYDVCKFNRNKSRHRPMLNQCQTGFLSNLAPTDNETWQKIRLWHVHVWWPTWGYVRSCIAIGHWPYSLQLQGLLNSQVLLLLYWRAYWTKYSLTASAILGLGACILVWSLILLIV